MLAHHFHECFELVVEYLGKFVAGKPVRMPAVDFHFLLHFRRVEDALETIDDFLFLGVIHAGRGDDKSAYKRADRNTKFLERGGFGNQFVSDVTGDGDKIELVLFIQHDAEVADACHYVIAQKAYHEVCAALEGDGLEDEAEFMLEIGGCIARRTVEAAAEAEAHLAGIVLAELDELVPCFNGASLGGHKSHGLGGKLEQISKAFQLERGPRLRGVGIDLGGVYVTERIAVRFEIRQVNGTNETAGTLFVFENEALIEGLGAVGVKTPGNSVIAAAGRKGDDHGDIFFGIGCEYGTGGSREAKHCQGHDMTHYG